MMVTTRDIKFEAADKKLGFTIGELTEAAAWLQNAGYSFNTQLAAVISMRGRIKSISVKSVNGPHDSLHDAHTD